MFINSEPIKFGTDGWRAVIAENYNFENVRRVSLAVAQTFANHPKIKNGIVIGYDTRFLSKEFAHCSAEIFGSQNIKVFLVDSFVTTPTVSLLAKDKNLAFGVMITASHNPYSYNGFKLKDEYGGSMSIEEIEKVEAKLPGIQRVDNYKTLSELVSAGIVEFFNGRDYYLKNLEEKIDIEKIKKANLSVIYDAMYGAGQKSISSMMKVREIHGIVNPYFDGGAPEPVQKNLKEICDIIKNGKYDIGIVNDGDADRIAIIDENGDFLDAQKTFALLLKYLHQNKKFTGKVVRGYSSSDLIKKYCDKYGLILETVMIGFKHISKLMINDDIMIGAEESGGIGIKGHLPERDGVFNGLLYLEMLAATGKSIGQLKRELENEFGVFFYNRIDVHTTEEKKNQTLEKCRSFKIGDKISSKTILQTGNLDGFKFNFENGWIIIRASGTEPLLRFYCETYDKDNTKEILKSTINNFNL